MKIDRAIFAQMFAVPLAVQFELKKGNHMRRAVLIATLLMAAPMGLSLGLLQVVASEDASTLANAEAVCPPDAPELSKYRHLRALSLDLRGEIPSVEELKMLDTEKDVPDTLVDDYLHGDGFTARAVELHRDLLWNNVSNLRLYSDNAMIGSSGGLYYRGNPAFYYRGLRNASCLNEPLTYNSDGSIKTTLQADGSRREGYVLVHPYWAPDTEIKVCGFDAQTAAISPAGNRCDTLASQTDTGCGCGPEMRWCATDTVRKEVLNSFTTDVEKRIADVIAKDQSYLDLFTGRTAYVNGPIVYFYRHQLNLPGSVRLDPLPVKAELLPNLQYADKDTWVALPLGEEHAGVLTSPAFLLRFMSNRARASRFYTNFLCEPFQPPEGGIIIDESDMTLDLQERNGCNGCHQVLEPAASYWGRWTENGAGFLSPEQFLPESEECAKCNSRGGCSEDCRRFYVYRALAEEENPWVGSMRWYEFRHEEHYIHLEEGPSLLANRSVADNRLPLCVAKTAATWLMGREPLDEEQEWLTDLSIAFVASGYQYRTLVRDIVTSPVYRRVQ